MKTLKSKIQIVMCFALIVLIQGCTTVSSMRENTSEGIMRTYDGEYKDAFEAARLACEAVGLNIAEENFDQKYIIARASGRTNGFFINYGEIVGIYFQPLTDKKVSINVATKRVYKPGILYYEIWDEDVHSALHTYLEDIRLHP